ncbi:fumarylacetoacetate hydrolase family protein [Mycolicibacterium sp.]|uniref:fumarylacetoacetate hydrolase family protein n=1 Tax=Mycolicibacterium sp. TaxID=2320850 RepID=UPI003D0EE36D
MRIANVSGRPALITAAGALDVARASGGQFSPDPHALYERWDEFTDWARSAPATDARPYSSAELGPPSPRPAQVFAIGTNYSSHSAEVGLAVPDWPSVFTKYVTSFTGPTGEIELPSDAVDWEVELVVVIGRSARAVSAEQGWDHVAGLTVGQDLSDREVQLRGPLPQVSVGKSLPGFSPTGPVLVTPDDLPDPDALEISCSVDGTTVQWGNTRDLVFSVPVLIAELSAMVPLLPGDVIFTGTPDGVGLSHRPPRFLRPGQELVSRIEGIGEMRHTFRAAEHARRGSDRHVVERLQSMAQPNTAPA